VERNVNLGIFSKRMGKTNIKNCLLLTYASHWRTITWPQNAL